MHKKFPFPIKLSKNPIPPSYPPAFISMLPGNSTHSIEEITAPEFTLEELLFSFFKIEFLAPEKIFLINKIITSDFPQGVTDVVIMNNTSYPGIENRDALFFKSNAIYHALTWSTDESIPPNLLNNTHNTSIELAERLKKYARTKYLEDTSNNEQNANIITSTLPPQRSEKAQKMIYKSQQRFEHEQALYQFSKSLSIISTALQKK